jgi:hypothetical protein
LQKESSPFEGEEDVNNPLTASFTKPV